MAMLALTSIVALNYITICRLHPNGGGVYSSVYHRSRNLAVVGALLLTADYVITTALSIFEAAHYLNLENPTLMAILFILALGLVNWFGPKNSGFLALAISLFTIAVLTIIIAVSAPKAIPSVHIAPFEGSFFNNWVIFVGLILSISGIEAISNMTGLMRDPVRDSRRAILSVLGKVVIATIFIGIAMHAIPGLSRLDHKEDMVRYIGEIFVGDWFGMFVGLSLGVLLISAGNTAINGLISVQFLMSVDRELPAVLRKLNRHGVPIIPLIVATVAPILVLLTIHDVLTLAQLYAIGVVGAIMINLGSTATDPTMKMSRFTRAAMFLSALLLMLIEATIVVEKYKATIFVSIVLAIGLSARYLAQRAKVPAPVPVLQTATSSVRQRRRSRKLAEKKFLVAVKDMKSKRLLKFALEEASSLKSSLIVLHVHEIKVGALPERLPMLADDTDARIEEMCAESGVDYQIITIPSNEVGYTIAEYAAMFGVDRVILGSPSRSLMSHALRGNVMKTVSSLLPEEIQLIIFAG